MSLYTASITPDSFSGAVFAIEGVADAVVVLNGPTGCKFYHSAISDSQFPRAVDYDPLSYSARSFFGQPRVPATYLDGDDYVFGSATKLSEALQAVSDKGYGLIVVINSPGAALIGDDLDRLMADHVDKTMHFSLESTGFSGDFGEGFQTAINRLIDTLDLPEVTRDPLAVNLLGISLEQKYFDNNYATIREMLASSGVRVASAFGATDTLETIRTARQAALNVVVCPENALETARKLEREWGTPYLVPENGQPIGFEAASGFVTEVCQALGTDSDTILGADPGMALEEIDYARARAWLQLSRYSSLLGLPKGSFYSIRASASAAYPLTRWLSGYLGMIPAAVEIVAGQDGGFETKLRDYLTQISCAGVLGLPAAETPTEILFADGDTITASRLVGLKIACVEIGYPPLSYLDITRKQLYGAQGALFLLEQIMNGLRYL
jgi:nitrogenase molybdenum-iron protein alpha/beta subunit